jgi:peptide/nickel transport system substrate-binding protein
MDTQIAENLQAQLAEVGINMGIRQWEFQALMEEVKKGEFDMVLLGWSPSTGDADQGLFPVFHSKEWPPASNRAHYANAKVDRLLEEAKMEVDPENRLELYRQAQEIIMDEAAWIFLHYPKQVVVTQSNVTGLEVLPTEHILFAHVDK